MRLRSLVAPVLLLVFAALTLIAPPAGARTVWQLPRPNEWDTKDASVAVASFADLSKKGFRVSLDVRFTCPKNKQYTIVSDIQELNPLREPVLDGDLGIRAILLRTPHGRCTGHRQYTTLRYAVQPFHVDEGQAHCWDRYVWDPATGKPVLDGQKCYKEGDYRVPIVRTGVDRPIHMGEPYVRVYGVDFFATYDAWEASCCGNAANVGFR